MSEGPPSDGAVLLDAGAPFDVLPAFAKVNAALLELLASLGPDDWSKPTVHRDRTVKDLVAHLVHGSLRRVSGLRDDYRPPTPPLRSRDDLTALIQADNRAFMAGLARVSPRVLLELAARYDAEVLALFSRLDPMGDGLGVLWAGEWTSKHWFDVAREYTEKWHHQEQLRMATGRPTLATPELLAPVLETFARGLPDAYRTTRAPPGTRVIVETRGVVSLRWTLSRGDDAWTLWRETAGAQPALHASIPAEIAWRAWTKGLARESTRRLLALTGDPALAEPLLDFTAIMA